MAEQPDDGREYEMVASFMIDGPAYSDRDREMFVLGAEFAMLLDTLAASGGDEFEARIHDGNRERVLYFLARSKRSWEIDADEPGWIGLKVLEAKTA